MQLVQTTKIFGSCWFSFQLVRLSNLNRLSHYSKDWMKKVWNWNGMKFHLQLKPFCLWMQTEERLDLNAIRLLHPLAYADNWCWSLWLFKNTFSSLKLHSHTSTYVMWPDYIFCSYSTTSTIMTLNNVCFSIFNDSFVKLLTKLVFKFGSQMTGKNHKWNCN